MNDQLDELLTRLEAWQEEIESTRDRLEKEKDLLWEAQMKITSLRNALDRVKAEANKNA